MVASLCVPQLKLPIGAPTGFKGTHNGKANVFCPFHVISKAISTKGQVNLRCSMKLRGSAFQDCNKVDYGAVNKIKSLQYTSKLQAASSSSPAANNSSSSSSSGSWAPQGECMTEVYTELVDRLRDLLKSAGDNQVLVAVAGSPGAGKSTITHQVCQQLNDKEGNNTAVVLPMDGFHYTRAYLDAEHDPDYAHLRRGAYFTFDAAALVDTVKQLRETGEVVAPSFDHSVGDPVEGAVRVSKQTRLVIIEGNYLLLDYFPWCQLADLFDERWFIDCDVQLAMHRVTRRHVNTGWSEEEAQRKVECNDRLNAELIASTSRFADIIVTSIEENQESSSSDDDEETTSSSDDVVEL